MLWPLLTALCRSIMRLLFTPDNMLGVIVIADENGYPLTDLTSSLYRN